MTNPLSNRIALVTGGSRGIGHALAIALAREGAHVVATARTPGGLEELDDAIKAVGGTATLVPLEMSDSAGIARLAGALNERYGKLDILVGNAALGGSNSPLDHFTPKEWDEVLAVNVTANWHLIRTMHALLLRSDAGRVVFLTSNAASNPRAYRGLYAASKAALDMIEPLAQRLSNYFHFFGVRGAFLMQLGRNDEACVAFDRAIALANTSAEAAHIRMHLDRLMRDSQPRGTKVSKK
jgi:NAD(P)-dependent dehydrogenase (short-subunit alcohol dehydrogenase family)